MKVWLLFLTVWTTDPASSEMDVYSAPSEVSCERQAAAVRYELKDKAKVQHICYGPVLLEEFYVRPKQSKA